MPYIRRDTMGRIASLHRDPGGSPEFLADEHTEVQSFVGNTGEAQQDFSRLDADFVRVIEDVIDTLIVKNLINITDLPEQAQAKLFARKSFRERRSPLALQLYPMNGGELVESGFGAL